MLSIDVEVEIGVLADLDLVALRERWRALYGSKPPPRMSRELLVRAIAYHIQEDAFGGLSRSSTAKLASAPTTLGNRVSRARRDQSVKPGTKFLREWNGHTHEVIAMPDGRFLYRDVAYRSLTAVASEITGTHWSGPSFFGPNAKRRSHDAAG